MHTGKPATRNDQLAGASYAGAATHVHCQHREKDSRIAESMMSEKSTLARTRLSALARTCEHRV